MSEKNHAATAVVRGLAQLSTHDITTYAKGSTSSSAAMSDTNANCNFLDLSRELRDHIYYFAAIDALLPHVLAGIAAPLLAINRQLHHEFCTIYYSDKIMTFHYVTNLSAPTTDKP